MNHVKTNKRKVKKCRRHSIRRMKGGKLCKSSNNDLNIYTINSSKKVGSTWYVYDQLGNEQIAIKKIGPSPWLSRDSIENELEVATIAGDIGAGPQVIYSKMCETPNPDPSKPPMTTGYLVMEKINGDLVWTLNHKKLLSAEDLINIIEQRKRYVDLLYDNGIKLGDHDGLNNIMYGYTLTNPEPRVWFIDFGESVIHKDESGNPIPVPHDKRNYNVVQPTGFKPVTLK